MTQRAALGFKLHTGWGVVVAAAGRPAAIQVLLRRRIELLPESGAIPRFLYHTAAEMPSKEAEPLVKQGMKAALEAASLVVKSALQELRADGVAVDACGVLSGSTVIPDNLSSILRAHTLIHAAEGALFQDAIVAACKDNKFTAVLAREREVWPRAASAWKVTEAALHNQVDGMRKVLGAPWSADHKASMAVALLALKLGKKADTT